MATLSAGLIKTTNLTVNGLGAGAVQATNLTFNSLDLSGNLTVGGQIFQPNLVPINEVNRNQITSFTPEQSWDQQAVSQDIGHNLITSEANSLVTFPIYVTDGEGNVTGASDLLTTGTPFNDIDRFDFYGHVAPLVDLDTSGNVIQIPYDGSNSYIAQFYKEGNNLEYVAQIHGIDKNPNRFVEDPLIPGLLRPIVSLNHNLIANFYAEAVPFYAKRGFPSPGKAGINYLDASENVVPYPTQHVFYNNMLIDGGIISYLDPLAQHPSAYQGPNVDLGIDLNPYINGKGVINFFISGGHKRTAPPQLLDSLQYTNSIPRLTLPVTTSSIDYDTAKLSNGNCVYHNEALKVLNILINDFGDYVVNYYIGQALDGSGVDVCIPKRFEASYGFYRNYEAPAYSAPLTNQLSGNVLVHGVTIATTQATRLVLTTPEYTQYLIQVSENLVLEFDFKMNADPAFETLVAVVPREIDSWINTYSPPVQDRTPFGLDLVRYSYGVQSNNSCQITGPSVFYGSYEDIGWPLMNNPNKPYSNENVNYLTAGRHGATCTLHEFASVGSYSYVYRKNIITDGMFQPETAYLDLSSNDFENLSTNPDVNQQSLATLPILLHEYTHAVEFGMGISPYDAYNNIYDDEFYCSITDRGYFDKCFPYMNFFPTTTWFQLRAQSVGYILPFSKTCLDCVNGDMNPVMYSGTNFVSGGAIGTAYTGPINWGWYFYATCYNYIARYDPNQQFYKLMTMNLARLFNELTDQEYMNLAFNNPSSGAIRSVNPNVVGTSVKQTMIQVGMTDIDETPFDNIGDFIERAMLAYSLQRNNTCIPEKYINGRPFWYGAASCPQTGSTVGNPNSGMIEEGTDWDRNMKDWDIVQMNEDMLNIYATGSGYGGITDQSFQPPVPWWPKDITGLFFNDVSGNPYTDDNGNPIHTDAHGRYYINNSYIEPTGEGGVRVYIDYTQETSTRGSLSTFVDASGNAPTYVTDLTRNIFNLQTHQYALPTQLDSITVELVDGSYNLYDGSANSDLSVIVYRYIPHCCTTGNYNDASGTFIVSGPHALHGTGATKTISLTTQDDINYSQGALAGTATFNQTFAYSMAPLYAVDPVHGYKPAPWNPTGMYQPITKILITNKFVSDVNFSDADIQEKLYLDQIKPSTYKMTVSF